MITTARGQIVKVSGPLVVAEGMADATMFDMVRVGEHRLIGEIIELHGDLASIQVYEDTSGLAPGAVVDDSGAPLSVELGPGLLETIYDGIQRPLEAIRQQSGATIQRGVETASLDRDRRWHFTPCVTPGTAVAPGDIIGTVQETAALEHRIMVPPGISGTVTAIHAGDFRVTDPVCELDNGKQLTLMQRWPVRTGRPYRKKLPPTQPLETGQRVIDTLFPLAKGGTACVPGPFGAGKTVIQHQLAKWSDVDLVVYIGCGERGNEMTDVLREFPALHDPRTGGSIMQRTVLIANTSDMPVAAREASIYTGIAIGEYYRDMGYAVAVIADSTSRWAEALREMSARLEEMPGEEGYPAYLASRLAQFYERAGLIQTLGGGERYGSLTAIGAVSPPGGDTSEPVSQATMRIVKAFWGLDRSLAYARHFPAIHWLTSYSLYTESLASWFHDHVHPDWMAQRAEALAILQREAELEEVVKMVGRDALDPDGQLTLETAKMIREDFLQQNGFVEVDWFSAFDRQYRLLHLILRFDTLGRKALDEGLSPTALPLLPVRERIGRAKMIPDTEYAAAYAALEMDMEAEIKQSVEKARDADA